MEQIKELQRTHGNFSGHITCDFPLDCEGLEALQMNETLLSVLGNIGGEKYILSEPTTTKGGYVFLPTQKEPTGELLYVEKKSGTNSTTVYVHTERVHITANGQSYNSAYIKRWLKWGNGEEQKTWADFKQLKTNAELQKQIDVLDKRLIDPTPPGTIAMWVSETPPDGWFACKGQEVSRTDFPKLYNACKNTFGTTSDPTKFLLPDMQGRFPIMRQANPIGHKGGNSTISLGIEHLPQHSHGFEGCTYVIPSNSPHGAGKNQYNMADVYAYKRTASEGQGGQFSILPPFIGLNFIIKHD